MRDAAKAKKIIARAKDKNAVFLDLGNLGITELPDELFELKQLEFLNLGSRYVKDMLLVKSINKGKRNIIKWIPWKIRRLTNLKSLSLHATYIGDIYGLRELSNLQYLDLGFGYFIRDYSSLKYLRHLEVLNLHTNYLKDPSFLKRLKKLKYLDLSFNSFKDLQFLKKLSNIEFLYLQGQNCEIDILNFNHFYKLKELSIGSNTIKNIDQFDQFDRLESLNLFDTNTANIAFLESMRKMRNLNLWRNNIKNIGILSTLQSLKKLNVRENIIEDIFLLKQLENLKELDISFNKIERNIENEFTHIEILKTCGNIYNTDESLIYKKN